MHIYTIMHVGMCFLVPAHVHTDYVPLMERVKARVAAAARTEQLGTS